MLKIESSCNAVVGIIDCDIVAGDNAHLQTKRVFYDTVLITKIDYDDKGGVWFEYTCPERSGRKGPKKSRRVTKKGVVGWSAVTELRRYR